MKKADADILRSYREKLGLSQRELAATLGVTQALISIVEAGRQPLSKKLGRALQRKSEDGSLRPPFGEFLTSLGAQGGADATFFGIAHPIPLEPWKVGIDLRHSPSESVREQVWVPGVTPRSRAFSFKSPPGLLSSDTVAIFQPSDWKGLGGEGLALLQLRPRAGSDLKFVGAANLGPLIVSRKGAHRVIQFEPAEGGPIAAISEAKVEVLMTCLFRGRYCSV